MKIKLTKRELETWRRLHHWANALMNELYADGPTGATENWLNYWLNKSSETLKRHGVKSE